LLTQTTNITSIIIIIITLFDSGSMAHKTQEHIYRNAKLKKEKKENEENMRLTGYTAATQQKSQPMSTV